MKCIWYVKYTKRKAARFVFVVCHSVKLLAAYFVFVKMREKSVAFDTWFLAGVPAAIRTTLQVVITVRIS